MGLSMLLSTPKNTQFKASNEEDFKQVAWGYILALYAWFAADEFARNTEKYEKTHDA